MVTITTEPIYSLEWNKDAKGFWHLSISEVNNDNNILILKTNFKDFDKAYEYIFDLFGEFISSLTDNINIKE